MEDERRSQSRLKSGHLIVAQYASILNRVRDVCPQGAFIEDPVLLPLGQHFQFNLYLSPQSCESIPINAVVRWESLAKGVGVEFLSMSEDGYNTLCTYCGLTL